MKTRCVVTLLVIALLLTPALAAAREPNAVTLSAEAGFDGYYRVGKWLPVYVQLQNDGPAINGRVEVVLPDSGSVTYQYPVELPTQSRKEITLYLSPRRYTDRLKIQLLDQNGQPIAQQEQPLKAIDANDRLYGILADQPSAFNTLMEIDPANGQAITARFTARHLPDRSAALDALDTLIISNVDTGALTEAQRTALAAWIASGGRLIVGGGASWQKTNAGLGDLLPLQPASTITLNHISALQSFANTTADPGSVIIATGTPTADAQPVVAEAGTPLITRLPRGFGEVYYLGFDPAALSKWDGLSAMYRQLIAADVQKPSWSYGVQDWGTAATAASMIPNLNLPPVSLICGFVVLYMAAIGPINYFVVRGLKRRELAWITAPLLAVGFLLGAFVLGTLMRGNEPALNRLALVQVWPASNRARVTGIVGLYAPQRAAYGVKADQGLLLHPPYDDRPYSSEDTANWTLTGDPASQHVRVDMDVSEVKTLSAEGDIAAPPFDVQTQIVVDSRGARAVGTVRNASDITLHDAVLLGPGQNFPIGMIQPGETVPVNFALERATRSEEEIGGAPYYNYNDSTVDDIAGPYSYTYGAPDQVRSRRYQLLSSLLYGSNTPYRPRGDGVYLTGWSDQSPLAVGVDSPSFEAYDTTLYIVDLKPALRVMSGTLMLPPGMFTWKSDNPSGPPISPYDTEVYPGTHTLQFNLRRPIAYDTVQDLILHLEGSGPNQNAIDIALWNYQTKDWTPLPNLKAGDNSIADPAQYVGPGGEIRVQMEAANNSYPHLDQLDFTLVVR
ncbi:MAG TPA: hypothetical protein VMP08_21225 [Anaerolineae bacterium]|nr:hypothetical protein [Anaerolineae bacterium]